MNTTHASRGLAAFALAALPLAVQAQGPTTPASDEVDTETLNPLTVTATRAPRTADETLASVTVIDEATLRRQDPTDITDLLRGQPGVNVNSNGDFGKATGVSIRGVANNGTLLMIDGIRLRSATLGGASWQFLDPRMFDRAEIVRGPRGSLYGADAVGGVVQLFTPEGEGEPTPRISLGGGSFDTRRASASLSGSEGGTRYHVAASRLDTDGYEIIEGKGHKGYDNTTGLVRLAHGFDNGAEVGVLAMRARGNTEFDSFGGNADTDFVQQVTGVYGELPVGRQMTSRLTLSESRDEELNTYPTRSSRFETKSHTVRLENTIDVGAHDFIVGGEYLEDSVVTSDTYLEDSRDNVAVFVQGLLDYSPVTVQPSLRFDDNEAFGEEVTGSLGLGYALDDRHTLRTSYATAFRAPTFNDLYYQDMWGNAGNPDLEAETSESIEVGVRGQYQAWFWDLAAYQTDIDDLIIWKDQGNWTSAPEQVDQARIRGVELSSGIEVDGWTLATALTWMDPEDRNTGEQLHRRASQLLRIDVDKQLDDWVLGGSWIAENHRYDYDYSGNASRLGGFGLLNLRAGWKFTRGWEAKLTVNNVLDKEYQTAKGYDPAGRAAYLSVNFGAL
ncbi:TonB-dependent receptor [Halomonas urmiana]|uniref:TonB-dependent receptor n=1 Tax=Halomonas urmiana TaxID=490901 RepID=A0A5R8MF54_9GAMM|nr:TonB-dependent receptor [Halomonas urmiana]TLF48744.1 TonB-dependent receptor [Halomonas urmiana]